MPSSHLILCHPLLLPQILPSSRVFSSESILGMKCSKYWSFSFKISSSNEHPGLIFFRMDWLDLLAVQGTLKSPPTPQFKSINFLAVMSLLLNWFCKWRAAGPLFDNRYITFCLSIHHRWTTAFFSFFFLALWKFYLEVNFWLLIQMPRDTTQNIHGNFFIFFELFTNISYTIQQTAGKWYIFFFQLAYNGKGRIQIYISQSLINRHYQADSLSL